MAEYREASPVAGPEAFESVGRDAELSQAAIVLSAGAAVGGRSDRIDRPGALALPPGLRQIGRAGHFTVGEAAAGLDLDMRSHLDDRALRLPASASADLTRRLIDRPTAPAAAALIEANLHSESQLVRTSAAVAALDTTGPRDDVLDRLVEGARARDELTREIGRIGVARVAPQHALLRRVVIQSGSDVPVDADAVRGAVSDAARGAAVLTHGTFSAKTKWWRPGGAMYKYLDALVPALNLHDPSWGWSGNYSDGARRLAAQQLVDWTAASGMRTPDVFAHSHGGTVANLATRRGLKINRLVLMGWPVHAEWFPDFAKVRKVIDIRVHMDLVILADRGGQKYTPPAAARSKVVSHVNGWFKHSDTNTGEYWDRYKLPKVL